MEHPPITLTEVKQLEQADNQDAFKRIEKESLDEILAPLTESERFVLIQRWGLDNGRRRSQREVGEALDRSRRTVGRIEKIALDKIRKRPLEDYLE